MLTKLLKYEFLATRRTFGALYLGLEGVAVLIGLLFRFGVGAAAITAQNIGRLPGVVTTAAIVLLFVYMALLVAVMVMTVVTVIERFAKNLLGGEGYLMHMLPVSAWALIASKMIAGAVWTLASGLAFVLSMVILLAVSVLGLPGTALYGEMIAQGIAAAESEIGMRLPVMIGGMLLAGTAAVLCSVLCIYAAVMIGHQFKKYTVPAAIIAFLVLTNGQSVLMGLIGVGSAFAVDTTAQAAGVSDFWNAFLAQMPTAGQVTALWGGVLAMSIVFGAAYYCITEWLMRKHLNLE